jgi:hypothetical protein
MKQLFILQEFYDRAIACYAALVKHNGPFAQIHGHIQIMGGYYLRVMEGLKKFNQ